MVTFTDPQKAAERRHGVGDFSRPFVEHDIIHLAEVLAGRVVDLCPVALLADISEVVLSSFSMTVFFALVPARRPCERNADKSNGFNAGSLMDVASSHLGGDLRRR